MWRASLLVLVLPAASLGAPPVPVLLSPADGGWGARSVALDFRLPGPAPANTLGVEFEFTNESGQVIATSFELISSPGTDTHTTAPLPDAGLIGWRARSWDDAGMTSAWTAQWVFRMDDTDPPAPGSFVASLDGGVLGLSCAPVVDGQSGLGYYHFGVSRLDQVDGGINFGGFSPQPSVPTAALFLGPGAWVAGVHAHDAVGNANGGASLRSGVLVVTASTTLPAPPPPVPVRSDGGFFPTFPYLPNDFLRFRFDGGAGTTGWALARKGQTETEWELVGSGVGPIVTTTLPAGPQEVRAAQVVGAEVSPWSGPQLVWVDEVAPSAPQVSAFVDGGAAYVRWPSGRDPSSGSGVTEYRVSRCCLADASVRYPPVAHQPDASFEVSDVPGLGAWSWAVVAIDRAGNESSAGRATTVFPPPAPANLRAAALVTNQPVALAWDEDRDGGAAQTWVVTRLDGDAGVASLPLTTPSYVDDAPEGRFSYVVVAQVGVVLGAPARLDGVVRDLTPPQASAPTVLRRGARLAEVSWTASDALAGLASVRVERETNRAVIDLGVQTSPFVDTPADDGTHRYRLVATDLAGNVTTTAFSVDFVTPGMGVLIAPVEPRLVTCGQTFSLLLSASEEARWSLVSAPASASLDATSGELTWTPTAAEAGTATLRVRADAMSSADERDVLVEVDCTRRSLNLGCGCSGAESGAGVLALALLAWRRRTRRA